jgi:hypothetical protein
MKKIALCIILAFMLLGSEMVSAQYLTAVGARFGLSSGLTVIQYFSPKSRGAADFHLATKYKGVLFTGLYEIHSKNHNEKIELANVGFFVGFGGHVGSYKSGNYGMGSYKNKHVFALGADVVAGVEWKIPSVPLLLSADIRPYYEYVKDANLELYKNEAPSPFDIDLGLSLRFVFR